jgi:hypothetical protein
MIEKDCTIECPTKFQTDVATLVGILDWMPVGHKRGDFCKALDSIT